MNGNKISIQEPVRKAITFWINPDVSAAFKAKCAQEQEKMQDVAARLMRQYVDNSESGAA
ncbi:MAG: hypothetical protein CVV44_20210 [Spirochaetae bacterium HGW-Spirochaetae-1]|jgi:chorismate mutase|nr:MAG: hypothetical protein CVV44_20210 [Spirochaetae bacterium HGW-Spirochaetae-1]